MIGKMQLFGRPKPCFGKEGLTSPLAITSPELFKNIAQSSSKAIFQLLKKKKCLKIKHFRFAFVGITGLEPATSRPPDVCATNCAKSRFCDAKVSTLCEIPKFCGSFFWC